MGGRAERLYQRNSGEPLSRGREKTTKEILVSLDYVVAATSSHRRISLIKHLFPDLMVYQIPVGEGEPDTPHTPKVVQEKLRRARIELMRKVAIREIPKGQTVIISADTQSSPIAINKLDNVILKPQSKPKDNKAVLKIFTELSEATSLGEVPYYTVSSSSGIAFEPTKGRQDVIDWDPLMSYLYLDPDMVHYYATPEGFADYQATFNEFYSSHTYTNGEEFGPITLTDMAAGLSIPVLTRQGAILQINEARRDSAGFPGELKHALSVAAAGIEPQILARVLPNASERMQAWPFLDRMTAYALGERI